MTANRRKPTMNEWHSQTAAPGPTNPVRAARDTPGVDDVRKQLGCVLASKAFRDSLRLKRFITFVVEATLAGASERIKAYTIAVEALGRGSNFDPQSDPIVRVEASRLRQALTRYYAAAGRNDPLVIDLPVGTYVPTFHRRGADSGQPGADATPRHSHARSAPGSDRLAEIAAHSQHLSDLLAKLQELLDLQRMQVVAVADAIASTTQTLRRSHALLKSAAIQGPDGAASRRHDAAKPRDPDRARASDPGR